MQPIVKPEQTFPVQATAKPKWVFPLQPTANPKKANECWRHSYGKLPLAAGTLDTL